MTKPTPLSCCIIAKNEGDRIGNCIRAIKDLVDEVVVVDSGSTDDTVTVAEGLGARVIHRDWTGYGPQKRFSEDCAVHDWILNLDADEVVTPELAEEIRALMREGPKLNAYKMKITFVYPGRKTPRLWANAHNHVRLYDRRVVRFHESAVHDTVDTRDEPVGQLKGRCLHYGARTLEHLRGKLDSYTDLQAKVLKKPEWVLLSRLPLEYPLVFLRYYLFRTHFTGGWDGVRIAHMAAEARLNRLKKILAAKRAAQKAS